MANLTQLEKRLATGSADRQRTTEPMTRTLWEIMHDIALTDDEETERREWVRDLMDRPEIEDELFEAELDNWESNR